MADVKLTRFKFDLFAQPLLDFHFLYIVLLVWRVHHSRHVVHVSLLCHTRVDTQVTVTQGVHFERELELAALCYILKFG